MPETVWIVEPLEYDAYGIMGVYASLEVAKSAFPAYEWEQTDNDWYTKGAGAFEGGYHIYEAQVQGA